MRPVAANNTSANLDLGQAFGKHDVVDVSSGLSPCVFAHVGDFAAAEHDAVDVGSARDFHFRVLGEAQEQGRCPRVIDYTLHMTHAAAIDVANAVFREGLDDRLLRIARITSQGVVAHNAAAHRDFGEAELLWVFARNVVQNLAIQADAGEGYTSAAIDVAIDLAVGHRHGVVAAHAASGEVLPCIVAPAAEDVAIPACGGVGANQSSTHVDFCIAEHMAVLAAAEQ